MTEHLPNDNHVVSNARSPDEPDAHGQAAMLLVESLIHGLIARSVVTVQDAVEIVGIAAEVKVEFADAVGEPIPTMKKSLVMLEDIRSSLSNDLHQS